MTHVGQEMPVISWGKSSRAVEESAPHSFPDAVTVSTVPVTGYSFFFGHGEKITWGTAPTDLRRAYGRSRMNPCVFCHGDLGVVCSYSPAGPS